MYFSETLPMKGLCIHAHCYQPPREDPFSGAIPKEPGAFPYAHWNERIHAECYRPNALHGNFERISFNVGPTLFEWMETADPEVYHRILEADRYMLKQHGVGNALAQSYHHTILPLATTHEKRLQIRWGIADFNYRFGHLPEGMWLPETAVDYETLNILAEEGIQFVILAPWQAQHPVDPTQPYRIELSGHKHLTVFFYHQELSGRVSFDPHTTVNADTFTFRDLQAHYTPNPSHPQLLLIASDGELYGHHKAFRDLFLKHLLNVSAPEAGLTPTYPALWLKYHPPIASVAIREFTSWSCHHGVARWSTGCDCTGGNNAWKEKLRTALRTLARLIDETFLREVSPYFEDPWELVESYLAVRQGNISIDALLHSLSIKPLSNQDIRRFQQLLHAQWDRHRMFTSCGWFFDDLDRIEPRNVLAYAAHAMHLTYQATGNDLMLPMSSLLQENRSPYTGISALELLQSAEKQTHTSSETCSSTRW